MLLSLYVKKTLLSNKPLYYAAFQTFGRANLPYFFSLNITMNYPGSKTRVVQHGKKVVHSGPTFLDTVHGIFLYCLPLNYFY